MRWDSTVSSRPVRRKKEDEEKVETMPEAEAESEVELLKEIRDLLSKED
jgi:large-conductance mechanosensitive channel